MEPVHHDHGRYPVQGHREPSAIMTGGGSVRAICCGRRSPVPADYDAIRAGNIARYGTDTAVLALLGQLYSDRAQFLYELIQNAEDAGATWLDFALSADRLEVRHNGRPFTG